MSANLVAAWLTFSLSVIVPSLLEAQSQEALARQHFDAAKKAAGAEWTTAAAYFAMTADEVRPSLPSSGVTPTEPMKVFDNVYLIGSKQVVVWAIRTSDGIVLIDAGGTTPGADGLIAGMKQLGLDARDIR